jgi:hypothetical protein
VLVLAILWGLAGSGVVFVFLHVLVLNRWPWTASKEEARAEGERVVAALEEYKAAHSRYPKTLSDAGIDDLRASCFYRPNDVGDSFSLFVNSGLDEWHYDSGSRRWEWWQGFWAGG